MESNKNFLASIVSIATNVISSALIILIGYLFGVKDDKLVTLVCTAIIIGIAGAIFSWKYLQNRFTEAIEKEVSIRFGIDLSKIESSSDRYKQLFNAYNNITKEFFSSIDTRVGVSSHFLLVVFHGIINKLYKDFQKGGEDTFYVDSDFYNEILKLTCGDDKIRAVADRTNSIEKSIWASQLVKVEERIFLLPWEWFFEPVRIVKEFKMFTTQSQKYTLKYNNLSLEDKASNLFQDRVGSDFFIVYPDIVGYYICSNTSESITHLKIIHSASSYKLAVEEIKEISDDAILFNNNSNIISADDLRRQWIQKNHYGEWVWEDKVVEERDDFYFKFYDIHIRCWIWLYDEMINQVIETTKLVIRDFISVDSQVKILEIGFGTGAVTIPLLEWIKEVNSKLKDNENMPIRFTGIDRASMQMKEVLEKKGWIKDRYYPHELDQGSAWSSLGTHRKTKYNIIIASLVVHDITEKGPKKEFARFLEEAKGHLDNSKDGIILVADIFPKSKEEIESWEKWMMDLGLTGGSVSKFKQFNMEMFHSVLYDEAIQIGRDLGYIPENHPFDTEYGSKCPFRVLSFRIGKR